ncbi:MAG: hypothetical protein Q9223_004063 [Gallowayella weberi]
MQIVRLARQIPVTNPGIHVDMAVLVVADAGAWIKKSGVTLGWTGPCTKGRWARDRDEKERAEPVMAKPRLLVEHKRTTDERSPAQYGWAGSISGVSTQLPDAPLRGH